MTDPKDFCSLLDEDEFDPSDLTPITDISSLSSATQKLLVVNVKSLYAQRSMQKDMKVMNGRLSSVELSMSNLREDLNDDVRHGVEHRTRIANIEDRESLRRGNAWKVISVAITVTLMVLGSLGTGLWWLASHAATSEARSASCARVYERVKTVETDLTNSVRPQVQKNKDSLEDQSLELTMVQDTTRTLSEAIWELRNWRRSTVRKRPTVTKRLTPLETL